MVYGVTEAFLIFLSIITSPAIILPVIVILLVVLIVKLNKKKENGEKKEMPRVGYNMNNEPKKEAVKPEEKNPDVPVETEKKNKYCANCGAALPEGAKFCTECGEKVTV